MTTRFSRLAPLSRRRFLEKSALAAGALALPLRPLRGRAAGSLKPVSMTLDWVYEGANSGYVVAHEQGFYRDAGLDVSITAGKGSATTAQLVASKASQIGFADGFVVGNGVSKGMNIKTVGSIFRRNPSSILVFEDSPIKSPKDLEGRKIAISAGSSVLQQWPAYCKGAGVDVSKVEIVNIDPAGLAPALINGNVAAIGAYVSSFVPPLEIRAKRSVRILWFADYGVVTVSNGMIVHNDLIGSDPDLIRAFVPASLKGFLYGRQHPDEAIEAVKKYQPTADPVITKRSLEVAWKLWVPPNTKGKPLGWGSEADWASTINVLHQYGGVTAPLKPDQLFTNEFIPTGAEFIPPQEA
jgi:NitT/TauT family transport system substrate-binding protein